MIPESFDSNIIQLRRHSMIIMPITPTSKTDRCVIMQNLGRHFTSVDISEIAVFLNKVTFQNNLNTVNACRLLVRRGRRVRRALVAGAKHPDMEYAWFHGVRCQTKIMQVKRDDIIGEDGQTSCKGGHCME